MQNWSKQRPTSARRPRTKIAKKLLPLAYKKGVFLLNALRMAQIFNYLLEVAAEFLKRQAGPSKL